MNTETKIWNVDNPFRNLMQPKSGNESVKDIAIGGDLLTLVGFKKYEGDDPKVKAFLEEDDIGLYYVIEKDGFLYVISRLGNDWFTFEGLFEEYIKKGEGETANA